jgi:outer membrane lipoprotein SlyB
MATMETKDTRRLHPLLATAAVAVIVLAVVGIGAFTGLLPGTIGSPKPTDTTASPASSEYDAAAQEPASAPKPSPKPVAKAAPKPAPRTAPKPAQVAAAKPVCADCGVVESVREVEVKGEGTGLGAIAGGVLGGVVGHQVGGGRGKDVMTVLGAAGGAYAGHQVEKKARSTKHWEITVRLDGGGMRTISMPSQPAWRAGDRVRVVNDSIEPEKG